MKYSGIIKIPIFSIVFLVLVAGNTTAQQTQIINSSVDIPVISLLDIEPSGNKNITFNFTAPVEAGVGITQTLTNNNLWLNYTNSAIAGATTKKINAQLSVALPQSLELYLQASTVTTGAGTRGTPSSLFKLSTLSQSLISGIGRCYTGQGSNFGHRLNYSLSVNQNFYDTFESGNITVQIIFTITD